MDIKCDVIGDLLPSYIDKLTSESSNELVEEHLNKCKNCKALYEDMIKELPIVCESNKDLSDISEIKLMKKIKSKIRTVITTIIVTFSILGFIMGVYGKVIFQEGNPIPLISSIIKLEFSNEKYVKYSSVPDKYISEVKADAESYKVMKDFMMEKGWTFKEQMGAGFIFEKDGELMAIGTRQYTKKYFLWSIPKKESKVN
jgi:hypothetical protein